MFLINSFVVVFAVFVIVKVFASTSENPKSECHGMVHMIMHGETCCNNQSVTPGINNLKQWKECASASTDDDETYNATMWRIYICLLQQIVPKNQKTISLVEFGIGMTDEYPEALKVKINEGIKYIASHDKNNESVPISEVDFKDIEKIDEMRLNYFDIEIEMCGWTTEFTYEDEMNKTVCSLSEEWHHRRGDCCNNRSIPIQEPNRPTPKNCDQTLMKFKEKLDSINSTAKSTYLGQCEVSCILIQKGVLTVDELISFNVSDELPTEKILNALLPNYYSKNVRKQIQENFAKKNITARSIVRHSNEMRFSWDYPAEMNGCVVHTELSWYTSLWLVDICY